MPDKKDVQVEYHKYQSDLRRVYIIITEDMLAIQNANIHWDECKINTVLHLVLKNNEEHEISCIVNENLEILSFTGDLRNEHELGIPHWMTDYDLTFLSEIVTLSK